MESFHIIVALPNISNSPVRINWLIRFYLKRRFPTFLLAEKFSLVQSGYKPNLNFQNYFPSARHAFSTYSFISESYVFFWTRCSFYGDKIFFPFFWVFYFGNIFLSSAFSVGCLFSNLLGVDFLVFCYVR